MNFIHKRKKKKKKRGKKKEEEKPRDDNSFFLLPGAGKYSRKLPVMVADKYKVKSLLGYGSFGCIYSCVDLTSGKPYAVKFEHIKARYPQLLFEKRVYEQFHRRTGQAISSSSSSSSKLKKMVNRTAHGDLIGIPKVYWFGTMKNYNVLVMEKLGPNVEDLFNFCQRKFSLKTILMVADQMISRIEFIHSLWFIHRDLKPENFLFGVGSKSHWLYLVDFGLAKKYFNEKTKKHIQMKRGKPLTGTARYTSVYSHLGFEQSRRDDLESLGYILIYYAKGHLPWQGLQADTKEDRYEKISLKKLSIQEDSLASGLPSIFVKYISYVRKLKFDERPDYNFLRGLFRNKFRQMGYVMDFEFDWVKLRRKLFAKDDVSHYVTELRGRRKYSRK